MVCVFEWGCKGLWKAFRKEMRISQLLLALFADKGFEYVFWNNNFVQKSSIVNLEAGVLSLKRKLQILFLQIQGQKVLKFKVLNFKDKIFIRSKYLRLQNNSYFKTTIINLYAWFCSKIHILNLKSWNKTHGSKFIKLCLESQNSDIKFKDYHKTQNSNKKF